MVTEALAAAGDIHIPAPATSLPDLERNQHVWLQAIEGTNWVDLDPSISGSAPGAVHTLDPSNMTNFRLSCSIGLLCG